MPEEKQKTSKKQSVEELVGQITSDANSALQATEELIKKSQKAREQQQKKK